MVWRKLRGMLVRGERRGGGGEEGEQKRGGEGPAVVRRELKGVMVEGRGGAQWRTHWGVRVGNWTCGCSLPPPSLCHPSLNHLAP